MTLRIRLLIVLAVLICLVLIVRQVRQRAIRARYLVIWVSLCVVVLPLAVIPRAVDWISEVLGIYYPPATFLLAAIFVLFLVIIDFSRELSKLDERTRILAEELALARLARRAHESTSQAVRAQSADVEITSTPPKSSSPTAASVAAPGAT